MYINFEDINPSLLNIFSKNFNLNPKNITILYKISNIIENKFDDFEKSIFPYKFIDNTYYLLHEDNIYKLISKYEASTKTCSENIISSTKLKISKVDIFKMYHNLNSLFTIFKDDSFKSKIKIISLINTPSQKTLKYVYIHGSVLTKR